MIRVLIAAGDAALRERLRNALATPEVEIVALARDGQEAVQMAHALRPDIAILAAEMPACDGWQATEFLAHAGLPTAVLLLSNGGEDDLRRAMRAGAREHLTWPRDSGKVSACLRALAEEQQRRHSAAFAQAADPQRMCRIVTVSGAKGGVGKTTLATNLALALHLETREPVVLMDLYMQFGDVSMMLNLSPRRGLAELAAKGISETDLALLDDYLERHESGLDVLTGATTPVALDAISAPFLDHVLGLLKRRARFLVLDVPPILHPTTLHALSHANLALLVANLFDLTTARDTRLLLDAIEGRYVSREKIAVALNRVSRQNRLSVAEIVQALDHPITAQIPNDGRLVPQSVNQGQPFVLSQPRSAVAQSVRALACRIAAGARETGGSQARGGQG